MDYSTAEEHVDAWAPSPEHNRTSFESPSSPPFPATTEHEQEAAHEQPFATEEGLQQSSTGNGDSQHPPPEPQTRDPPTKALPTREQQRARRTRQDRPQYKLQAKITSVERNGRKDPILKFDVYVRAALLSHSLSFS